MIPATYDATKHYKNPLNVSSSTTLSSALIPSTATATTSTTSNTNPFTGAATTTMTINTTAKSSLASASTSQIPSYYGMGNPQRNNSFHKQHQHQQQPQQPSQLPQSLNQYNSSNTTINYNQGSTTATIAAVSTAGGNGRGIGGGTLDRLPSGSPVPGGSGSSSATSSSPLSPPSITSYNINKDPDTKLVSEMHKLCRKSPFMPKKFMGSSSYNRYNTSTGGGDESPKKESVFTSIGQSILRNLTTSPFSQKKNVPNSVQPNQIDPLFRMPCQDVTHPAFDTCDHSSITNTAITTTTDSPALQRKRFQMTSDSKYNMTAATKASNNGSSTTSNAAMDVFERQPQHQPTQEKSSMIPLTINEAQPQRVPGNHSPLGK